MALIVEMHPNTNNFVTLFCLLVNKEVVIYRTEFLDWRDKWARLGFSLCNVFDMNVYFLNKNILTWLDLRILSCPFNLKSGTHVQWMVQLVWHRPLSEEILTYFQLDPQRQTSVTFELLCIFFHDNAFGNILLAKQWAFSIGPSETNFSDIWIALYFFSSFYSWTHGEFELKVRST